MPDHLQEMLPTAMRRQLGVPTVPEALPVLHFPNQERSVEALNAYATPEHQRLAFEELFLLQLALAMRRQGQTQGH